MQTGSENFSGFKSWRWYI